MAIDAELREPGQGGDVARPEDAVRRARGEPDHTHDLVAREERHPHHRLHRPGGDDARPVRPGVVVVDGHRLAGQEDLAADAPVDRLEMAHARREEARCMSDHQLEAARLGDVDVAMRRAQQRAGTGQDGLEEHRRVATVQQGQGRLVQGSQVRVVVGAVGGRDDGLGQVHRPVGDRDEGVLRAAVVRIAGDADADRHVGRARVGQVRDRAS